MWKLETPLFKSTGGQICNKKKKGGKEKKNTEQQRGVTWGSSTPTGSWGRFRKKKKKDIGSNGGCNHGPAETRLLKEEQRREKNIKATVQRKNGQRKKGLSMAHSRAKACLKAGKGREQGADNRNQMFPKIGEPATMICFFNEGRVLGEAGESTQKTPQPQT